MVAVLVSRNPAITMALAGIADKITEVAPTRFPSWLESEGDVGYDALILDLGSSQAAIDAVGDLRARGHWIPVLIIASIAGADRDLLALPRSRVIGPPIDAARLREALTVVTQLPAWGAEAAPVDDATVSEDPADEIEPSPPTSETHDEFLTGHGQPPEQPHGQPYGQPLLDPVPDLMFGDEPTLLADAVARDLDEAASTTQTTEPSLMGTAEPVVSLPPSPVEEPLAAAETDDATVFDIREKPVEPQSRRSRLAGSLLRPVPSGPPTRVDLEDDLRGQLLVLTPTPLPDEPESAPHKTAVASLASVSSALVTDLVEALLSQRHKVFGVRDTSEALVADALSRVYASGAALLVPDGEVWRVAAEHGLRPLETRYQLEPSDWLVEHVAYASKGVIVEGSDVARHALRGAPLASRRHLLAVPIPVVGAILLMARDDDPGFDEDALGVLASVAREAQSLLQEAIRVRELSRSLAEFRNVD